MENYPIALLSTFTLLLNLCFTTTDATIFHHDVLSGKEKMSKEILNTEIKQQRVSLPLIVNDTAKKSGEQKYFKIRKVSMEIKKDDSLMILYKNDEAWRAKNVMSVEYFIANVNHKQTRFKSSLVKYLEKNNYIDTTESIFPNYQNTSYIEAVIEKVKLHNTGSIKNSKNKNLLEHVVCAETQIKWVILDYYKVKQDSITIIVNSEDFYVGILPSDLYHMYNNLDVNYDIEGQVSGNMNTSPNSVEENGIIDVINNSVELSLSKLVENEKFKKLTDRSSDANKYTSLKLKYNKYESKTLNDLIQAAVTIKTGKDSHCSGFLISDDGYIVTTYHNFANNKNKVTVILNSGAKFEAKIERISPMCDLALLKIDGNMLPHMQIKKYEVKDVLLGSDVSTIGTPTSVELGQSIAKGTVSGTRKPGNITYIQTSIAVNSGSSGGAILNEKGEVLGVVTSKLYGIGIEGIAFVIPSKYIFEELKLEY